MIKLIKMNMLPYREEARKAKQKQFQQLLILAGIVGVGISALIFIGLSQAIGNQESRNAYLSTETEALNAKIKEVSQLKQEKEEFLARKSKVEELQNRRFTAAQVLNSLNTLIPDGVYLTTLKSSDDFNYSLTGKANSDNKVAMFMKALPSSGIFELPELESIKKDTDAQSFSLKVSLVKAQTEDASDTANNNGDQ